MRSGGIVYLVGAGPGDPELVTRRALELTARADVILYDRLIPDELLSAARPGAELRYVGKRPRGDADTQAETNAALIELARAGHTVVRLKGGDPFVFGRGGEEAQALAAAGVEFEVVPGVTAGVAALAYAGIPVTHRDEASAVAFITGRSREALDWDALARFPGTLVFYMGVAALEEICSELQRARRAPTEPAAVVERGTLPGQRVVEGTLETIAARAREAGLQAPAVTVVGPVARLRSELAWLERRPLHGRTVVVTRARAQASSLSTRLRDLGAAVVEAPAIRIEARPASEVDATLRDFSAYALVCVTSPNGAALLFDALERADRDARALAGTVVAAIGPGTARELARRGIRPDVVPERFVAEGLVEALADVPLDGRRVLVARAAAARDVLPEALAERGAEVDVVDLYDTVAESLSHEQLEAAAAADYVTFTSSSTVDYFARAAGGNGALAALPRVVSIGPVTSAAARAHGLTVAVEARRHDIEGLVEALLDDVAGARPAER